MMPAYLICDVSVHNREKLVEYLELAKGTVELFGGKYLAQAGDFSVFEGDWSPQTIVVVEFPTTEAAREWHQSESYAPALKVKPQAMIRKMLLVQGL
jgi:uncharacterized protein (DUF1330 family)